VHWLSVIKEVGKEFDLLFSKHDLAVAMFIDGQVFQWALLEQFLAQVGTQPTQAHPESAKATQVKINHKTAPSIEIATPEYSQGSAQKAQALTRKWFTVTNRQNTPDPLLTPPPGKDEFALPSAEAPRSTRQPSPTEIQPISAPSSEGSQPAEFHTPDAATVSAISPRSGSQLYAQRLVALRQGKLYTRLPANSFQSIWSKATQKPSYTQWKSLLSLEARAVARGQGNNRLSVLVGDSISQWYPSDRLPQGQLWLNQGISGDNTRGILSRLAAFAQTRPDTIYVMAGINDLKQGATDDEVLTNLRQIMRKLRQAHPQAQIIVQSILPTDGSKVANARIWRLNEQLATITDREGVNFLNLHPYFADATGRMRPELTTDGLHLNPNGYATWQWALRQVDDWLIASGRVQRV
jgi:lysophospholipase L1-like esterase